jgi:D-sedoheptulose 7-phosphate isomerase
MNSIEESLEKAKSVEDFSTDYFSYLFEVLKSIDSKEVRKLVEELDQARINGKNIFVAGNGGSASTAITMANDLGFDIIKKTGSDTPFRIFSLVDNSSVLTAISNDVGYENIFINQLKIHFREGDLLIVISASGNSPNLLKATSWVKEKKGKVIGFLGFTGGKLLSECDIKIHLKTKDGEYGPVEDGHLVLNHVLAHWFQYKLK